MKRAKRRGKDLAKLRLPLEALMRQDLLPARYRDHPLLLGKWHEYREIHLEPDWLLIYRVKGDELQLARTGSHADLFRK